MAPQSEHEELLAAWRALNCKNGTHGWQVIDLIDSGSWSIMAGRHSPGNEESLLIRVPGTSLGNPSNLPTGKGFVVVPAQLGTDKPVRECLAVIRRHGGDLGLFTKMASDLVLLCNQMRQESGPEALSKVLSRIKAWQRFMSRERSPTLSPEEEIGLIGELAILRNLITDQLPEHESVEAWIGPDDGLHDFRLGTGGIESKTTLSPTGFIAQIANLDQLDDALFRPLYVGAVRLQQSDKGNTLPEFIDSLLSAISDTEAKELLESKLAAAGYLGVTRSHYSRRFVIRELTYRLVTETTPRLVRSNVPTAILDVRYRINLDHFPTAATSFRDISKSLGTIS